MADALTDLLVASGLIDADAGQHGANRSTSQRTISSYLTHLTEQPLNTIQNSESQQLAAVSHSLTLSLQGLSKKSHKAIVDSASGHASLRQTLPTLSRRALELSQAVPQLDIRAERFSTTFSKASTNHVLDRRRDVLRLLQNSERLVDVMELTPLLESAVLMNPINYASTLDLYAHVRRLVALYPDSGLVGSVITSADSSIRQMTMSLISALNAPSLKLAAAVRTIGWLRRLISDFISGMPSDEVLPTLFLVCRFITLIHTLAALSPLKDLADKERQRQSKQDQTSPTTQAAQSQTWSNGQQTERYLKRYIEIFREHSFNVLSIFKSINGTSSSTTNKTVDPARPLPSISSTLTLYLTDMLLGTLQVYLPVVRDPASRESILTQVLYCAGSFGRLGADFSMLLSVLGTVEWVELVKRHRLLAGRLESVIGEYRVQRPKNSPSTVT